jgi:molybdate transport system permease protein
VVAAVASVTNPWLRLALLVLAVAVGVAVSYLLVAILGPMVSWLRGPQSRPFWLSLRVAIPATAIAGVLGIAGGYALAKSRFPGRDLLETIASLPIILPPTVLGYYLLTGLGNTWEGRELRRLLGHSVLFNVTGCIIAASVAAFPFSLRAARAAVEGVDHRLEQAAQTMGLSRWRVAMQVTLPLARRGLSVGLVLAFVRALGEYGATLMVGGDIAGSTRTMPLAVADATTTGQHDALVHVLLVMAVISLLVLARLARPRTR